MYMWSRQVTQVLKREATQSAYCRLNHGAAVGLKNTDSGDPDAQSKDYYENQQQEEKSNCDMVGPIDPISNIRPLRLRQPTSEAEREIQKLRIHIWATKHHFWAQHNTEFKQEKSAFVQDILQRKRASGELADDDDASKITSDELSVFYRDFLHRKYEDQMSFTRHWMKLNILLTWKQFKYRLQSLFGYTR